MKTQHRDVWKSFERNLQEQNI